MEQLKRFRQLGSHTPGHPEANHGTPGIEVTTGPLGQGTPHFARRTAQLTATGFANAVGLAMAQAHTSAVFNRPGFDIVSIFSPFQIKNSLTSANYTYCYFGDGCAQ